jgi:DNA polymerase-3 subunit epsilon
MENILIIDTETSALTPNHGGQVLEIGAILFNIPTRSVIHSISTLLYADKNDAYEINKIDVESCKKVNDNIYQNSIITINEMIKHACYVVAHNAEFDKKWLLLVDGIKDEIAKAKWICTKEDVLWPVHKRTPLNLIHICANLGVPIMSAHRAYQDCLLLCNAIDSIANIEYFLIESGKGRMLYKAQVSFDDRQLAKDNGFNWDTAAKGWFALMHPDDVKTLPFLAVLASSDKTT